MEEWAFVERFSDCGLSDMGAIGAKFTWFRKIHGRIVLQERLDRALLNSAALLREAKLVNLPCRF